MPLVRFAQACCALVLTLSMCDTDAQRLSYKDILKREAVLADQRVAYGRDPLQFADLWLPKTAPGPAGHPVVVLVHGGCWLAELPGVELTHWLADGLRNAGYAVWEIEYRRLGHPGGGYPETFLDVAKATDHLRAIAKSNRLNLDRVVATGHSAGGHLALWLAARAALPEGSALRVADPLPIHAVVGLAAIPDLEVFATAGAHACGADTVQRLVDLKTRPAPGAFRDTSPVELPIGVPQYLIHGEFDAIVIPALGDRYREKKSARRESIALSIIKEAGHFELIAPWTFAWPEIAATFGRAFAGIGAAASR
ncbi:MAG TPA: alpha/beta hydrolase [Usitatibacteraceae bacterium]|nr:alpha/beta hydrolase [Usitatibacteraceae bacterium]